MTVPHLNSARLGVSDHTLGSPFSTAQHLVRLWKSGATGGERYASVNLSKVGKSRIPAQKNENVDIVHYPCRPAIWDWLN